MMDVEWEPSEDKAFGQDGLWYADVIVHSDRCRCVPARQPHQSWWEMPRIASSADPRPPVTRGKRDVGGRLVVSTVLTSRLCPYISVGVRISYRVLLLNEADGTASHCADPPHPCTLTGVLSYVSSDKLCFCQPACLPFPPPPPLFPPPPPPDEKLKEMIMSLHKQLAYTKGLFVYRALNSEAPEYISNLYTHPPSRYSKSRNYHRSLPRLMINIFKTSISFSDAFLGTTYLW